MRRPAGVRLRVGATRGAARKLAASLAFISGHPSNARRETALVPGGLVAMDDLLVDHAVDDRNGSGVALLSFFLLASGDGVGHPTDGGAHARAHGHVMGAVFLSLTGRFFSGLGVRHEYSGNRPEKGGGSVVSEPLFVNAG